MYKRKNIEVDYDVQEDAFGDYELLITKKNIDEESEMYDEWSRITIEKPGKDFDYDIATSKFNRQNEQIFTKKALSRKRISDKDLLYAIQADYFPVVEEAFLQGKNFEGNPRADERDLINPMLFCGHSAGMHQFLLKLGVNPNATNMDGDTVAHTLVSPLNRHNFHKRCSVLAKMKMLIEAGADLNKVNAEGKTPLYVLLERRGDTVSTFIKTMSELLVQNGADINIPDNNGKTIYDVAFQEGDTKLLKVIHSLQKLSAQPKQIVSAHNQKIQNVVTAGRERE